MRRIRGSGIVFMVAAIVAMDQVASWSTTPVMRGAIVAKGSVEQQALVRWATSRFERAGLEPPAVEIYFDGDPSGCADHWGIANDGRVDVCTTIVNAMTRKIVLHEMGHIWLDQNLTELARERFLASRGLSFWNKLGDPWEERGYEQAAEIVAWGLGEGILTPTIPDNEPERLEAAFELLTGQPRLIASA